MRTLILTLALSLTALTAAAQTVPTVPTEFPAPGTFCGAFTLCPSPEPVTRDTRG